MTGARIERQRCRWCDSEWEVVNLKKRGGEAVSNWRQEELVRRREKETLVEKGTGSCSMWPLQESGCFCCANAGKIQDKNLKRHFCNDDHFRKNWTKG